MKIDNADFFVTVIKMFYSQTCSAVAMGC